MNDLIIRQMKEEDIPTVVEIEKISFTTPWSETSFHNEIYNPRSTARCAIMGQRLAGFVCASQVADEGHILDLAVHPDFRRKGIAKALVQNIIEELRENACRFLYLEVRASNDIARKFYEGIGFRVVGTRKSYYLKPEEDAIILMLGL